jgi:hypothetical protein
VRPQQVIDDRPLLIGTLESQFNLEPIGVGKKPERFGHDHAATGLGREDHGLAGNRRLRERIDPVDRADGPPILADDVPEY